MIKMSLTIILLFSILAKPLESAMYGSIAQLGEHLPYKQGVTGSSPVVPTNLAFRRGRLGPVVQLVRTPACHAGGRRFEPVLGRQGMQ